MITQGPWRACHCCCVLVIPGREGPQPFLSRLQGVLFTANDFHCCQAISVWAAESSCYGLFIWDFLIVHGGNVTFLSFTVKFTGDEIEGSCSWVPCLHLHFINTVLEVWLKIQLENKAEVRVAHSNSLYGYTVLFKTHFTTRASVTTFSSRGQLTQQVIDRADPNIRCSVALHRPEHALTVQKQMSHGMALPRC